jgi:hypothetical protein
MLAVLGDRVTLETLSCCTRVGSSFHSVLIGFDVSRQCRCRLEQAELISLDILLPSFLLHCLWATKQLSVQMAS